MKEKHQSLKNRCLILNEFQFGTDPESAYLKFEDDNRQTSSSTESRLIKAAYKAYLQEAELMVPESQTELENFIDSLE